MQILGRNFNFSPILAHSEIPKLLKKFNFSYLAPSPKKFWPECEVLRYPKNWDRNFCCTRCEIASASPTLLTYRPDNGWRLNFYKSFLAFIDSRHPSIFITGERRVDPN